MIHYKQFSFVILKYYWYSTFTPAEVSLIYAELGEP